VGLAAGLVLDEARRTEVAVAGRSLPEALSSHDDGARGIDERAGFADDLDGTVASRMTDRHDVAPPGVPNAETAVAGASPGGGRQAPLPRMPSARENAMAIDQVDRTVVTTQ